MKLCGSTAGLLWAMKRAEFVAVRIADVREVHGTKLAFAEAGRLFD
jgi:hypothetical protein